MDKRIINTALFSLFHHDIGFGDDSISFNTVDLYENAARAYKMTVEDVANSIYGIITEHIGSFNDSQILSHLPAEWTAVSFWRVFSRPELNPIV